LLAQIPTFIGSTALSFYHRSGFLLQSTTTYRLVDFRRGSFGSVESDSRTATRSRPTDDTSSPRDCNEELKYAFRPLFSMEFVLIEFGKICVLGLHIAKEIVDAAIPRTMIAMGFLVDFLLKLSRHNRVLISP
jgi:hypothetical protein